MQAIECLLSRNACSRLCEPAPSEEEQATILSAALRAPDHARLRPWRFISIQGNGLQDFADIYAQYARLQNADMSAQEIADARAKGLRAPWVVAIVANIKAHDKVPELEQYLSAGAAGQNILLASHALGYGAIWRTGNVAYSQCAREKLGLMEHEQLIGFLYIGTVNQRLKSLPEMPLQDYVTFLE